MANANGEIVSLSAKVVGFIKTGNRLTDKSLFTIPIKVLQKELSYKAKIRSFCLFLLKIKMRFRCFS